MLCIEQQGIGHGAREAITQAVKAGFDAGNALHDFLSLFVAQALLGGVAELANLPGESGPLGAQLGAIVVEE